MTLSADPQRLLTAIYILAGGRPGVPVDAQAAKDLVAASSDDELRAMASSVRAEKLAREKPSPKGLA